jgi:hypothetical protein
LYFTEILRCALHSRFAFELTHALTLTTTASLRAV